MPGGIAILTVLAAWALVLSGCLFFPDGITSVADFDPDSVELPEGLAADQQGNFYVGMALTGEIKRVTPQGEVSTFANLPSPGDGFMVGIATDRQGDLFVALASFDPDTHGVWKVSENGSNVQLFAPLSVDGLPNYLAFDGEGDLYVSDSFMGVIWRVDSAGEVQEWSASPLLGAGPGGPLGLPVGVNGIAFDDNQRHLYAANTLEGSIVRIPVEGDGSAGVAQVLVQDPDLLEGADGIAFDERNNLYVAVNHQDRIVRVSPEGETEVLVEGDGLQFPASLTFGVGPESENLYITNFALLRFLGEAEGAPGPALVKLPVGTPGLPLP